MEAWKFCKECNNICEEGSNYCKKHGLKTFLKKYNLKIGDNKTIQKK